MFGQRGFSFLQNSLGLDLLDFVLTKQPRRAVRFSEVTLFLCLLKASQFLAEGYLRKALYS